MASLQQRLPENVPGDFFVDSTCIDCDTCSQLAPAIFRDHGDQCSVYHQPETDDETQLAMMALVSCPTGSIGAIERHDAHLGIDAFPLLLEDNVYFCGFTSEVELRRLELFDHASGERRRQHPDRLAAICDANS